MSMAIGRAKNRNQKIFVNRSLNMSSITSIGFDMDHTLAPYNRENFEALAFNKTLEKLIHGGYPEELSQLKFDPKFVIRGLLVDVDRGNLLKVDSHKYVKIAFHGRRKLDKKERHSLYNSESYKAQDFISIDTFFGLSEVQLYTEIVDYMNTHPGKIEKSFREIYLDVKQAIDLSHRDGTIKKNVLSAPEKYINKFEGRVNTLTRLIESGKDLFLMTNSHWEYTNTIMGFLFDSVHPEFSSWKSFFRYIIVGAGKPNFFTGNERFSRVLENGDLVPHDNELIMGEIYHGGNAKLFQNLTQQKGDEILYLGDHIYGDIIRSKELFNWRTLLVVEELDSELPLLQKLQQNFKDIKKKNTQRELQDETANVLRMQIRGLERRIRMSKLGSDQKKTNRLEKKLNDAAKKLEKEEEKLRLLSQEIKNLLEQKDRFILPVWGELMRVGLEKSRFARQVELYACLYTSRFTNFRFYSPSKRFISHNDIMPHDY